MRTRLPNIDRWTPEFQRQLNGELERSLERLNEYALVPYGGLTGQVLTKTSDRPYVMEWTDKCCGGAGNGRPVTYYVGAAAQRCGATTTVLDIAADFPDARAGDMVVWVIYVQTELNVTSGNPIVTLPAGWEFLTNAYHFNEPYQTNALPETPLVAYRFLEEADLTSSFTATSTNPETFEICSYGFAYRNVSRSRPFTAPSMRWSGNTYDYALMAHGAVNVPGNCHLLHLWMVYGSSGMDEAVLPLSQPFGHTTFDHEEFGAFGTPPGQSGNDIPPKYFYGATWQCDVTEHPNWLQGETPDTILTSAAGWAYTGVTHSQTLGNGYALLTASGSGRHYAEKEVTLEAGQKYTFDVFFQSTDTVNEPARGVAITYVDPSSNERGFGVARPTNGSALTEILSLDPLTDLGTVWHKGRYHFTAGPLQLHFTAQESGVHKIRVNCIDWTTTTLGGMTFAADGLSEQRAPITSVNFRNGWHAPRQMWTPTGAGADYESRAEGIAWRTTTRQDAAGATYTWAMLVGINPDYTTFPLARLNRSAVDFDNMKFLPDNPLKAVYLGGYGDSNYAPHALDILLMPTKDGAPAKYYLEAKVTADTADPLYLGLSPLPAALSPLHSSNRYPVYSYNWNAAVNDVIGMAVDFANHEIKFYKNNTLVQTTAMYDTYPTGYYAGNAPLMVCGVLADSGIRYYNQVEYALKSTAWTYAAPSGFIEADWQGDASVVAGGSNVQNTGGGAKIGSQGPNGEVVLKTLLANAPLSIAYDANTITFSFTGLTTKGDLLTYGTGVTRLASGANGQILSVDTSTATGLKWINPPSTSPTTTLGDLIRRGASADERLAIGTDGQVLTVVSGQPAWAAATGGSGGSGGSLAGNKHVDNPPTAPDAADDEFNGTALESKWAWRNQGSATAVPRNGCLVLTAPATASDSFRCVEQTVSGSFKFRAKYANDASAAYGSSGIAVFVNSSGKGMSIGRYYDTSGQMRVNVKKLTNATTVSSNPIISTVQNDASYAGMPWQYAEIEYDGTSVYFRMSETGVEGSFVTVFSETAATFLGAAPDRIALFANSANASAAAKGVFDWVRKIGTNYEVQSGAGVILTGTNLTHVDAPPLTPDSVDDEFEGTALNSKWTWVNQSTATATVAASALTLTPAAGASASVNCLVQSLPASGDWKYRTKHAFRPAATSSPIEGMVLRESSTGKLITFAQVFSTTLYHQVVYWTNPTTFSSTPLTINPDPLQYGGTLWVYYEIEKVGTTLYFRWSRTGVDGSWYTLGTLSATAHLAGGANQIGLAVAAQNATATPAYFEWFRCIPSTYVPGTISVNARLQPTTVPVNPDTKPSTPNAFDDEFEGTALDSKWVQQVNTGTVTPSFSEGHLVLSNAAINSRRAWSQAVSGTFRVRMKLTLEAAYRNDRSLGWLLQNVANNKQLYFVLNTSGTGTARWLAIRETNFASATYPYTPTVNDWRIMTPQYFEVESDGTTIYFRHSHTGVSGTFLTYHSETIATHLVAAPDRVGFSYSTGAGSTGDAGVIDWIRRMA